MSPFASARGMRRAACPRCHTQAWVGDGGPSALLTCFVCGCPLTVETRKQAERRIAKRAAGGRP